MKEEPSERVVDWVMGPISLQDPSFVPVSVKFLLLSMRYSHSELGMATTASISIVALSQSLCWFVCILILKSSLGIGKSALMFFGPLVVEVVPICWYILSGVRIIVDSILLLVVCSSSIWRYSTASSDVVARILIRASSAASLSSSCVILYFKFCMMCWFLMEVSDNLFM